MLIQELFTHIRNGQEEIVKRIIEEDGGGSFNNIVDRYGKTALHFAASHGDVEDLHKMMKLNPEIDQKDKRGQTALFSAAYNDNLKGVQYHIAKS